MKKIKISGFTLAAMLIGIAFSSFTASDAPKTGNGSLVTTWFKFQGSTSSLSQIQDYNNYMYEDGLPCAGSSKVCAVETQGIASPGEKSTSPFSTALKSKLSQVFNHTATYGDISQQP